VKIPDMGLHNWVRRRFQRAKRRSAAEAGASSQWLAGIFVEPPARNANLPRRRELAYRLYLPADIGASERLPLLVMLHGCSQTAVEFADGSRMNTEAEKRRCAVLYPEQSRKSNSLRCWNWFEADSLLGHGEAALLVDAVRHLMAHYPIDTARVYVAGFSAGGAMVAVLCATHGQDLFAACAIHSGVMFHAATTPLQALQVMSRGAGTSLNETTQRIASQRLAGSRLVPTLIIQGTDDQTVNPINAVQIAEQLRLLARRLHPDSGPLAIGDKRWIESGGRRYCQQDTTLGQILLIRSIVIDGLGHGWSGGAAHHMFFDAGGPDASQLVLEFLWQHRLAPNINASATPTPSTVPMLRS
jgi:poly(hydroxyalkanoate) depolymerase family esterase